MIMVGGNRGGGGEGQLRPPVTPHPTAAVAVPGTSTTSFLLPSSKPLLPVSNVSSTVLSDTGMSGLPLNLNDAYSVIMSHRTLINQLRNRINDLESVVNDYREKLLNYELNPPSSTAVLLSQPSVGITSPSSNIRTSSSIGSPSSSSSSLNMKSPLQKYNLPQSPSFTLPLGTSSFSVVSNTNHDSVNASSVQLASLTEENTNLRNKVSNQEIEINRIKEEKTTLLKNILDAAKKLEDYKIQTEKEKAQLAFRLGKESALAAMASVALSSTASSTVISPRQMTSSSSSRPNNYSSSSSASVSSSGHRLSSSRATNDHHSVRSSKSSTKVSSSSRYRSPSIDRSDGGGDNLPDDENMDEDVISRVSGVRDNISDRDDGEDDDEYIDDENTTVHDTNDVASAISSSHRRGRSSHKHSEKKMGKSKSSSLSSSRSEEPVGDTKRDGSVTPTRGGSSSSSSAHKANSSNNVSTNSTIKASEGTNDTETTTVTKTPAAVTNDNSSSNTGGTFPPTSPNLPTLSTAGLLARGEQLRQQEMLLLALKQQQAQTRMVALAHQKQQQYLLAMQNQYQSPANMFMQNNSGNNNGMYNGSGGLNNTPYGSLTNSSSSLGNYNNGINNTNNMNNNNRNYMPPTASAANRFAAAGIDVTNGGYGTSGYGGGYNNRGGGIGGVGSSLSLNNIGGGMNTTGNHHLLMGNTNNTNGMYGTMNTNGLTSGNMSNTVNNTNGNNNNNPNLSGNMNPNNPTNAPVSPLAGVKSKQLSSLQENLQVHNDGTVSISGTSGLPPGATHITMVPVANPPTGGWSVYQHPPWGTKWPDSVPFFAPLVEPGIPILKHGRLGRPKRRLLWMDISNPSDPTLVWQEGEVQNIAKVKDKDRMRLIDILDIRAGRVGPVLERSGKEDDASRYISFSGENRTLDVELPTPEAREFVFKKFADLFQAYATAQLEKLSNDAITMRVAAIVDGGANSKPGSTAGLPPPPPPGGGGNNHRPPPSSQRAPPPPLSML